MFRNALPLLPLVIFILSSSDDSHAATITKINKARTKIELELTDAEKSVATVEAKILLTVEDESGEGAVSKAVEDEKIIVESASAFPEWTTSTEVKVSAVTQQKSPAASDAPLPLSGIVKKINKKKFKLLVEATPEWLKELSAKPSGTAIDVLIGDEIEPVQITYEKTQNSNLIFIYPATLAGKFRKNLLLKSYQAAVEGDDVPQGKTITWNPLHRVLPYSENLQLSLQSSYSYQSDTASKSAGEQNIGINSKENYYDQFMLIDYKFLMLRLGIGTMNTATTIHTRNDIILTLLGFKYSNFYFGLIYQQGNARQSSGSFASVTYEGKDQSYFIGYNSNLIELRILYSGKATFTVGSGSEKAKTKLSQYAQIEFWVPLSSRYQAEASLGKDFDDGDKSDSENASPELRFNDKYKWSMGGTFFALPTIPILFGLERNGFVTSNSQGTASTEYGSTTGFYSGTGYITEKIQYSILGDYLVANKTREEVDSVQTIRNYKIQVKFNIY